MNKAFLSGLTQPSPLALGSMAVSALLCFGLACATLGPELLSDPRWWAANRHDDDIFVTAQVEALDELAPGSVVLLGASGMRECYTGPEALSEQLAARTARRVPVLDLSTNGQTLSEAAILMDALPEPATVVVGVALLNFLRPESNVLASLNPSRLGVRNEAWEREVRRWGGTPRPATGVPFVDQFRTYGPRLTRVPLNLLRGPVERQRHRYLGIHPNPNRPEPYGNRLKELEAWSERHIQVLVDLKAQAAAQGHTLVVFETPMNARTWGTPEEQVFFTEWEGVPTALRAAGLTVVALPEGTVNGDDFADPLHLNNLEAQARVTESLADLLAPHL